MSAELPVLECHGLSISYYTRAGEVPAVVDFNLSLMPGEAHGIVGESGCGKSTVALAIMNYMGKNGAFAGDPKIVIADEPVSSLDVSVRAAVTGLLMDTQRNNRTTLLFISHDLSVVRYLADRIVVMYLGQIMEKGATEEIFSPPYHPYTEALLSAVPIADTSVKKRKIVLHGELPSPSNPPKGCPFSTRCLYMIKGLCDTTAPPLQEFAPRHVIACHLDRPSLLAMQPVISIEQPAVQPQPARV